MENNGRTRDREFQQALHSLAAERIREGESVCSYTANSGMCRTAAYKRLSKFAELVPGAHGLASHKGTERKSKQVCTQKPQKFYWVNVKDPLQGVRTPLRLLAANFPAHEKAVIKKYAVNAGRRPTLNSLRGDAPEPNPEELVWSHAKQTDVARKPVMKGKRFQEREHDQLQKTGKTKKLDHSFFRQASVAYTLDC